MPFDLIEALYTDNRKSFAKIYTRHPLPEGYAINDQLLLYKGRLYINRYIELYTKLIRKVYNQVSVAHPSSRKTYQLLAPKYHWVGIETDCLRYICNCITYRLSYTNVTKQQGFLYLLPVPEYPI